VQLKSTATPRQLPWTHWRYQCPIGVRRHHQRSFCLDNRQQAEPHFRRLPKTPGIKAHAASGSHDPNQVAQIYNYPAGDGTGQCIGLIELGGGFQLSDITTYFDSLNITPPQVISVSVDGGSNSPTTPDSADGEVMLDIEVVGAVAPAAKMSSILLQIPIRDFWTRSPLQFTTARTNHRSSPSVGVQPNPTGPRRPSPTSTKPFSRRRPWASPSAWPLATTVLRTA